MGCFVGKTAILCANLVLSFHVSHWYYHLYRSSAAIDPPGKLVPLDLEDAFCLPAGKWPHGEKHNPSSIFVML